ncbi:MAG: MFS transporter [Acidobacteria bacterium]|nr:MFS transporter [Acidobacteriota bacterium]
MELPTADDSTQAETTRSARVRSGFVGPYAAILGRDGAWRFSLAGWFARLVRSTAGISTILLIAAHGQSYAIGGAASGAVVIGAAIAGPFWSRAADRLGQTRVTPVALVALTVSAVLLLLSIQFDLAPWTWVSASFLIGASAIDAGALVRARWIHLLAGSDRRRGVERHTALAFEAVLDEFTFVIGPPLVTIVAAAANPVAGFLVGVGATLLGGVALVVQRRTAPVPSRVHAPDAARGFRAWLPAGVLGLLPSYVGVGLIFGSVDLTAVGISRDVGTTAIAGILLAVFALGSVTSGFLFGVIGARWSVLRRLGVSGAMFAVVMPWFAVVGAPLTFAIVSFCAGLATTPILIASSSMIETLTARENITVAMSWPSVAMSVGVTIGAAMSGAAIDHGSSYGGLWVPLIAAALVALATAVNVLVRGRRRAAIPADGRP